MDHACRAQYGKGRQNLRQRGNAGEGMTGLCWFREVQSGKRARACQAAGLFGADTRPNTHTKTRQDSTLFTDTMPMKTFLPLCAATLLLAVSLPLSAAPDGDRAAVQRHELETQLQLLENNLSRQVEGTLRDEMRTQFQHLERKLSGQVEDAALATARQERRLTELENELHKLQEERKTWLDDAQNPIIATAEKKKEEVRATGDRYVSMVSTNFSALGVLAAIIALVPAIFSIANIVSFNESAKQKLKDIERIKYESQKVGERYIEDINNILEKHKKTQIEWEDFVAKTKNSIRITDINSIYDIFKNYKKQLIDTDNAQALIKNGRGIDVLWGQAMLAMDTQQWEKACSYWEDILVETPQDETAQYSLALCQVKWGANPNTPQEKRDILWNKAETYYKNQQRREGVFLLSTYIKILITYAFFKEIQANYASSKEDRNSLLEEEYKLLRNAHSSVPDDINILIMLATCRYEQANISTKENKRIFLKEGKNFLDRVLQLAPKNIPALQLLSRVYWRESKETESPSNKESLLNNALDALNKAKELNPQNIKTLKLLAGITKDIISCCTDDKKKEYLRSYKLILEEAKQIAPHDIDILGRFFLEKVEQFDIPQDNDKDSFNTDFQELCNAIINTYPHSILVAEYIINSLGKIASKSDTLKRNFLFKKVEILLSAIEKIAPSDVRMLKNFAALRLEQAIVAEAPNREDLLLQAETYLNKIEKSDSENIFYNRACIAALRGQSKKALELLEECSKAGTLPSCEYIESDKALDSLRDQDAFKEFMERIEPAKDSGQTDAKDDTEDSE